MDEDCHDKLHNYIPKPLENAQENTSKDKAVECKSKCSNESTDTNKSWLDIDGSHIAFGLAVAGAAIVSLLLRFGVKLLLEPNGMYNILTDFAVFGAITILALISIVYLNEEKHPVISYLAYAFLVPNAVLYILTFICLLFN